MSEAVSGDAVGRDKSVTSRESTNQDEQVGIAIPSIPDPGEPIRGRVARILNSRELVINRGTEHGVEIGMRFAVLNSKGAEITDPDSGELLGSVDVEKTFVKVVRVQERMCVARTFRTFRTPATGLAAQVGARDIIFGSPASVVEETLRTSESTYQQEMDEKDSYVKRGDPVVQVIRDSFMP
jgi:hypothetical protein